MMERLYPPIWLGETAEEVADRWRVSREDQDRYALASHRRAFAAEDRGLFAEEMIPVETADAPVDGDEGSRRDTTLDQLAELPPVFRKGGSVAAGNSSPMNDGAAPLFLLVSGRGLERIGVQPFARFVGSASVAVHPDVMGIGPVPAARKVMERGGWEAGELDLVELNEAFASQSLAVIRGLGLDPKNVNVNGGAIALGHPLVCSGARLTTTILHEMRGGGTPGEVTMCLGGRHGTAMLLAGGDVDARAEHSRSAVVVGTGTMGAEIAFVLSRGAFDVTLVDQDAARAEAGVGRAAQMIDDGERRGKLDAEEALEIRSHIAAVSSLREVCGPLELIVEAVPERLNHEARDLAGRREP